MDTVANNKHAGFWPVSLKLKQYVARIDQQVKVFCLSNFQIYIKQFISELLTLKCTFKPFFFLKCFAIILNR